MPGSPSATPEAKSQEEHHGLKGEKNSRQKQIWTMASQIQEERRWLWKDFNPAITWGGGKDKHAKEQHILEGSLQPYQMCYDKCVWTLRMGMVAMKGPTKILQQ